MTFILKYNRYFRRQYVTLSQKILSLSTNKNLNNNNCLNHNYLLGQRIQKPSDINTLTQGSIENINLLHSKIVSRHNADSTNSIEIAELFDDLSNTICSVADWAACIATVHPSSDYRNAAIVSNSALQNIVHAFNMDTQLYLVLEQCMEKMNHYPVDNETVMVIKSLLDDFKYHGILLDSQQKPEFLQLQQHLDQVSYDFTLGCIEKPKSSNQNLSYDTSRVQWEYLREMLNTRHHLSQYLGHINYAEWIISRSMAKSVSNVELFLEKTQDTLTTLLEQNLPDSNKSLPINMLHDKYLSSQMNNFSMNFPYFLNFLCEFVQSAYNIRLTVESLQDMDVWDSSIIPIKVEQLNNTRGYIYLDLFSKEFKSNVSCHFTLFGRKLLRNNEIQLPRVYLSVPILCHNHSSCDDNLEVSIDSITEFMHEFGHSLHSILYQGKYQHLSGTRCSTDISEIPSTLFESFLQDSRFLSNCQNKLDKNQTEQYCRQVKFKKLVQFLENNMSAIIDLQINNINQPYSNNEAVISVIREVYGRFGDVFEFNHGEIHHQFFQHFANYGARYYSYLWAQACAGLIYKNKLQDDIFNVEAHREIERFLLSQGAIIEGDEIMSKLTSNANCNVSIEKLVTGLIL